MTSTDILTLSTQVVPAKTFTVDGVQHKLLSLAHLSDTDEARMTAISAQFRQINHALESGTVRKLPDIQKLTARQREIRAELIACFTDIPVQDIRGYPIPVQMKLLELVTTEMSADDDEPAPSGGSSDDEVAGLLGEDDEDDDSHESSAAAAVAAVR